MSTPSPTPAPDSSAPSGIKKLLPFVLALVLGLVAGGASGAFVVGPALAAGIAPGGKATASHAKADDHAAEEGDEEPADEDAEGEKEEGEEGEGDQAEGEKGAEAAVHTLDNLVLNPAQSDGSRFLLVTVTFELKNAAVLDKMKARDAELRDAVLVTLGAKSVEQLADMTQREALKAELKSIIAKLFAKGAVKRIYFPQFVIQ